MNEFQLSLRDCMNEVIEGHERIKPKYKEMLSNHHRIFGDRDYLSVEIGKVSVKVAGNRITLGKRPREEYCERYCLRIEQQGSTKVLEGFRSEEAIREFLQEQYSNEYKVWMYKLFERSGVNIDEKRD